MTNKKDLQKRFQPFNSIHNLEDETDKNIISERCKLIVKIQ